MLQIVLGEPYFAMELGSLWSWRVAYSHWHKEKMLLVLCTIYKSRSVAALLKCMILKQRS